MDDMSESERAMLFEWTRTTVDEAVVAGLVIPPWRPTAGVHEMLHGYYISGLSPAEAAQAAFGVRH
jgi:hypothetical protein